MVENIIYLLIQIVLVVALFYLILWVLGQLKFNLPEQVINLMWVVVALVIILLLYRALSPMLGRFAWLGATLLA